MDIGGFVEPQRSPHVTDTFNTLSIRTENVIYQTTLSYFQFECLASN